MRAALVDSAPILAALNDKDDRHQICATFFANYVGRLLLPVTVFTEVCINLETRPVTEAGFVTAVHNREFRLVQLKKRDLKKDCST